MDNEGYNPADDPGRSDSVTPLPSQIDNQVSGTPILTKEPTETKIDMQPTMPRKRIPKVIPTEPYAGMGKEDLLRFSDTPYWNRMRMGCLILFWMAWLGLLAAVIVLTIVMPRCKDPPVSDEWQRATYYQVYVRSFYDSDGDGIGDLKGVEEKLDYIQSLNIDTVILSSFYQSQADGDFGYDITDHKAVNPVVGDMTAFEELLAAAHEKGMKIVVEFVPNHTGDQHEWFQKSAHNNSIDNPYWNYYIWTPCNSGPPNNWLSVYGESAWRNSSAGNRPECYLAQFLNTQPDLNLESNAVRNELNAILEFWLEKGVDGFRVNSPAFLFEDPDFSDEPGIPACVDPNAYHCLDHVYTRNQADVYEIILEWKALLSDWSKTTSQHRLLLTDADEVVNVTMQYYGIYGGDGADLAANYQLSRVTPGCTGQCLQDLVEDWIVVLPEGATSSWATSNQDMSRLGNIWGEEYSDVINMLGFTLPGPSILYYGDEIGMVNAPPGSPRRLDDPAGNISSSFSRDGFRTPMQWSDDPAAGFTNDTAYIQVNPDYTIKNVEALESVDDSILGNVKLLSHLYKDEMALHLGDYTPGLANTNVFSFLREFNGQNSYFVAVNVGTEPSTNNFAEFLEELPGSATVVVRTPRQGAVEVGDTVSLKELTLQPAEGVVVMWEYSR
jgi:neutral and basic amino acid transporter 1